MSFKRGLILAGMVLTAPLWADAPDAEAAGRISIREQARAALSANAPLPTERPTLPDAASDRAREAHGSTAFGQKGAAQKAARSQAAERVAGNAPANSKAAAKGAATKGSSDARTAAGQAKRAAAGKSAVEPKTLPRSRP